MWLRKTGVKASLGDSECIWLFIADFGCPTSKSKQKRSTEGEGVWVYLIFNIVVVVFFFDQIIIFFCFLSTVEKLLYLF